MKNGELILHPAPPRAVPRSVAGLVEALQDIGFLGSPLAAAPGIRYLAGERFLQLVIFLGCSPHITLEPLADGSLDFCHVSITGPAEAVQFITGSTSAPPRCPHCRSKIPAWRQIIQAWRREREGFRWTCPSCDTSCAATRLNWRRGAGFGRFFIEIQHVFPGEAVPGDELLRTLEGSTGAPWSYFYVTRPLHRDTEATEATEQL